MGKKIGLITLGLLCTCSLAFADDAVAPAKKIEPAKMQMPEMPALDPSVWNFLPETIAVIGDKNITKKELVKTLAPQVKMIIAMGQKLQPEQYQMLAKKMTDELVKAVILEKLATDAGFEVTPKLEEEVYQKFTERFKKQLPEGQNINFADIIKKQGLTIDDVKKQLAKGEVIQEWVKAKIAPEVKIDDATATKFYNENKTKYFERPETVTASHILIKPKAETPEDWKEAKVEAEKVYKEVQDDGNFAELAKKYSQGPSASKGGELGPFSKGQMVPEFEAASWKLAKDNKIEGIDLVKTKFGWHIIKVTAYDPGGVVKLDKKVLSQIKEQLQQQAVAEKIKELVEQETAKLKPVINLKDCSAPEQPKAEQPKAEQPKVEQPKVEQPKVEQPKVEQPKVEQPVS